MVDIQPATAEIRRGKKRRKETTGQKYNGLPYFIGRPQKELMIGLSLVLCCLPHTFYTSATFQHRLYYTTVRLSKGLPHIIMVALWNRADHYIFALWFLLLLLLLLLFFPRLIWAVADLSYFHTWCGLSANLGCRSETCCTRLAEIQDAKRSQKIAIWAPSHKFVGLYLRN